jgi:hypothetical protein
MISVTESPEALALSREPGVQFVGSGYRNASLTMGSRKEFCCFFFSESRTEGGRRQESDEPT